MTAYNLNVNGKILSVDVAPETPLLWVLRDTLELTGTKFGCGQAYCGSCTVQIDGEAERSCTMRISTVGDSKIRTIEGLSADGSHPLQKTWLEAQVSQCGYCQAGMIMSCAALLEKNPKPSDADIDEALGGHICRCGTYPRIRRAIHAAAKLAAESRETNTPGGAALHGAWGGTPQLAGALRNSGQAASPAPTTEKPIAGGAL